MPYSNGSARFLNVFDIVLEDEEIRFAFARQADERLVVILDGPGNFLAIHHLHAHRRRVIDQALEVFRLFERMFRRARRLSALL
jgi:hypothetical protein